MYNCIKDFYLTKNKKFKLSEFVSKACKYEFIYVPEFWEIINTVRDSLNVRMYITDHGGFRPSWWNRLMNRFYKSDHEIGIAIDCTVEGNTPYEVYLFLKEHNLLGDGLISSIGIYDTFIHLGARHLRQSDEEFNPKNGKYYFWDKRTKL